LSEDDVVHRDGTSTVYIVAQYIPEKRFMPDKSRILGLNYISLEMNLLELVTAYSHFRFARFSYSPSCVV
jgi:hypothetical protein